jgi:hypothetical protein
MYHVFCPKQIKARKTHRCYLCNRDIVKKDIYILLTSIIEGAFCHAKMHEQCYSHTKDWDEEDWAFFGVSDFVEKYLDSEARWNKTQH